MFAVRHLASTLSRVSLKPAVCRATSSGSAVPLPSTSSCSFLVPRRQYAATVTLGRGLKRAPGHGRRFRRIGRGFGSHRGGSGGVGKKGLKARSGGQLPFIGFEGGQTPFFQKHPERGSIVPKKEYRTIYLSQLKQWIDVGRIDPTKKITMKVLRDSGIVRRNLVDGVTLIARGAEQFDHKIDIEVSRASKGAIETIERNGGKVSTVYFTRIALQAHLKPHRFIHDVPSDVPRMKTDVRYYTKSENRGYMAEYYKKLLEKQANEGKA